MRILLTSVLLLAACPETTKETDVDTEVDTDGASVTMVATDVGPGFLSVRAVAADDVWVIGSSPEPDDESGPVVMQFDGTDWSRLDLSAWAGSELWWGHITATETILVGNNGLILEGARGGELTPVSGPDSGSTFFGVWGATADDVWAVGMTAEQTAEVWRRQNGVWAAFDMGLEFDGTVFKVAGTSADDLWIVGSAGFAAHWDGTAFTRTVTGNDSAPLLTIDVRSEQPIAVGGFGNGLLFEWVDGAWTDASVPFQPGWNGVCSNGTSTWAVGQRGIRAERLEDGSWLSDFEADIAPAIFNDWHGCDVDPDGGLWIVGGRIGARPLKDGAVMYQGTATVPEFTVP